MRLLRHKRNRKTLEFFRLSFGARPPYKVLVDGNFVAQAAAMQQEGSFERLVQQLFGGETAFLHVTECVLAELAALGAPAVRALAAARTLSVIRCRHKHGHAVDSDPAACITALVGAANALHYVVATQDKALRAAMRAVPGTPVLLYSKNVLVLEPPSAQSRGARGSAEAAKAGVSAEEAAAVRAAKRALREQAAAAAAAAATGGGGGGAPAAPLPFSGGAAYSPALPGPPFAGAKRRRGSGGGVSGPNPLSVKKPVKAAAAGAGTGAAGGAASGRPPATVAASAAADTEAGHRHGGSGGVAAGEGGPAKRARGHHRSRGGSSHSARDVGGSAGAGVAEESSK